MSDEIHQDQVLPLEVIHKLMDDFDDNFCGSQVEREIESIVDQTIFVLVPLKGTEVLKLVLGEVRDYFTEARKNVKLPKVVLPLQGRFKGETRESFHFVVVTAKTDSDLKIEFWLEREIVFQEKRRFTWGYFFTNEKGDMMRSKDLEVDIWDRITRTNRSSYRSGISNHGFQL